MCSDEKNRDYLKWQTFNYLTVIEQWEIKTNKDKILVRCVCWIEKRVIVSNLIRGIIKSCWCKKTEIVSKTNTKRWMCSKNWIYNIFRQIKSRCENRNGKDYMRYWWRGIKCLRNNFLDFYRDMWESYEEHCKKFWKINTTIDRINNDWNYCKDNCRRATRKVQANNKRNNHKIEYKWKRIE